jgi:hypothetical protein
MTRRTMLSTLAAIIIGMVMAFAGTTSTASAQQNLNCCTYTVDINIPAACYGINGVRLWTRWSTGVIGPQIFNANGVYVFPTPAPGICPPASNFIAASLASAVGPWAVFNGPLQFNVNGCCLVARIGFDAAGCTIIYIRRC